MKDAFWKFSLDDFFGYLFSGGIVLSGIIRKAVIIQMNHRREVKNSEST